MESSPTPLRVAAVSFEHMHVGDQLSVAAQHPDTEVVGVFDTDRSRMDPVSDDLGIPAALRYTDIDRLLTETSPEVYFVCSKATDHLAWVERLARPGAIIILEKPFATSTGDAERMVEIVAERDTELYINWPLAWYSSHQTTARLIRDGAIGRVTEVHYYDGNRGPLGHLHHKKTLDVEMTAERKNASWWYSRESGGGSLLDYLGYGTTLGTWFRGGELPTSVVAMDHIPAGLDVDEQSVTVARYESGLSTFRTRWGTFTDPWIIQPQPFCGFVVVGTGGTILSPDLADTVRVQTVEQPEPHDVAVDESRPESRSALALILDHRRRNVPVEGPTSAAVSLAGQRIVDAALESVRTRSVVDLPTPPDVR